MARLLYASTMGQRTILDRAEAISHQLESLAEGDFSPIRNGIDEAFELSSSIRWMDADEGELLSLILGVERLLRATMKAYPTVQQLELDAIEHALDGSDLVVAETHRELGELRSSALHASHRLQTGLKTAYAQLLQLRRASDEG